jgi:NAD(P)-dependent dehydrogenase (short-subunit alcohol dehydrogenase family)
MLLADRGRVTVLTRPVRCGPMTVLRQGLLGGRTVALAGDPPARLHDALAGLGADVLGLDPGLDEDGARDWATGAGTIHAVVYDSGPAFGGGGQASLRETTERAWVATRAVATGALIPAGAGKIVLIGPRPAAGRLAGAVRAALENLARTLSVEWARYGVTAAAISPGAQTGEDELAELVCFLVSPAGEYLSGCLFELGLPLRSAG